MKYKRVPIEEQSESQLEAERRIRGALDKIERAQELFDDALALVCRVEGMAPIWQRLFKERDRVKKEWHALHYKLCTRTWDLDGPARETLAKSTAKR